MLDPVIVFLEPDKEREVRVDPALMKLLASDTRRKVLRKLGKRAMTLSELSRALNLKKATILEHLRRLEQAQLIQRREDERLWIYYDLTPRARSLVDPVGTRIMIVLGITAFALLMGAVIGLFAQSLLGVGPAGDPADDAFVGINGAPPDTTDLQLSQTVWWSGLDDDLVAGLPGLALDGNGGGGWLSVAPAAGGMEPLVVPVDGDSATIPREALDGYPAGTYRLHYLAPDGGTWEPLPDTFAIRTASIQVMPPVLLSGAQAELHFMITADGAARPTQVPVQIAGETLMADPVSPGRAVLTLSDVEAGDLEIGTGRLEAQTLSVLPDLHVQAELHEGPELRFIVTHGDGTDAAGIELHLGATHLGTTGSDGKLNLTPPLSPQGPNLLRLVTPEGHETAKGVDVTGWEVRSHPLDLVLEGLVVDESSRELQVTVRNLLDWEIVAMLVGTLDGEMIGATTLQLAGQEDRQVLFAAADPDAQGERFSVHAEGPGDSELRFFNETLTSGGGGAAPPPDPVDPDPDPVDPGTSDPSPQATFGRIVGQPLDWVSEPDDDPASEPEPTTSPEATPGPPIVLVIACAAVAGILARRRRG